MKDIGDAITYPMENDNWIVTTLIGGVLFFLSFLLIPIFIALGYVIEVMRGSFEGKTEPPEFGDWGALLVDGLQAWIIGIIYLIVPIIVGVVTIGGSITALATGSEAGAAAGLGGFFVGFLITTVLVIAFQYVGTIGVVNFAREEQFGAAFDFSILREVALSKEYVIAWIVVILISIVGGIATAIPLIGWIISPFISFYIAVVAGDLLANGFADARSST